MCTHIAAFPEMDALAHIDYICRYAPYKDPEIDYDTFEEKIIQMLGLLVKHDIAFEMNTRRLHAPSTYTNYEKILRAYKALGGCYVTLGSDAHTPGAIGEAFDLGAQLIQDTGLQAVYFKNRQRKIGRAHV